MGNRKSNISLTPTELEEIVAGEYSFKDYLWPLIFASGVTFITFVGTHPFVVTSGLIAGLVENVINIFNVEDVIERALLTSRIQFWGFLGALIYSFHLTFRRFLAYDLTPSVYIFIANRFALAFVVGTAVGFGVGTFSAMAGVPLNVNLVTVGLIVFLSASFQSRTSTG
jgi:hypothetical protein